MKKEYIGLSISKGAELWKKFAEGIGLTNEQKTEIGIEFFKRGDYKSSIEVLFYENVLTYEQQKGIGLELFKKGDYITGMEIFRFLESRFKDNKNKIYLRSLTELSCLANNLRNKPLEERRREFYSEIKPILGGVYSACREGTFTDKTIISEFYEYCKSIQTNLSI